MSKTLCAPVNNKSEGHGSAEDAATTPAASSPLCFPGHPLNKSGESALRRVRIDWSTVPIGELVKLPFKKFKTEFNRRPPGQRENWLRSVEAFKLLGAEKRDALLHRAAMDTRRIEEDVCSGAWLDQARNDGARYPLNGMVLATGEVRYGEGRATQRWTPADAAWVEDQYDLMTVQEASWYQAPTSPSAIVIQQIGAMKAKEIGGGRY